MLSARSLLAPTIVCTSLLCGSVSAQETTGAYTFQATPLQLLGEGGLSDVAEVFAADEPLQWEVVIPDTYREDEPSGMLVFISPSDSGRLPRGWMRLLETHNLIWIGANGSGNRTPVVRRVAYAVLAVPLIADRYAIDHERIYLAGYSGGARVSGLTIAAYPSLFDGAIYAGGAEMWEEDKPPADMERMRRNRFVFLVGSEDDNRAVARRVHNSYADAGLDNLEMMVVRRMGHVLPEVRQMNTALRFLDAVAVR